MANNVTITITSKNGTKQTFDAIATDANAMAGTLESASARSAASYEKLGNAIGKIGLAVGGLSLLASKANADAEASQARLSAAIEATGATFEDYAAQIKSAANAGLELGFDDEDLQNSISQLIQSTGNVSTSITDMSLAEDIARGRGIALADAARIVGLAEQGRTGTLLRLGIQIDANATKEEALAALQTRYAGQADAYGKTTAASWDRVKNSIENAAESAGSHLASIQLPIIALSSSAAALGPLVKSIKEIEVEGTLLEGALGPIGLAGAALAAGAGLLYLATRSHEYVSGAQQAIAVTDDLTNMIVQLEAVTSPQNQMVLENLEQQVTGFITYAGTAEDRLQGLRELAQSLANEPLDLNNQDNISLLLEQIPELNIQQLHAIDINKDNIITYNELQDAINGVIPAISGLVGLTQALNNDQLKRFQTDFSTFMSLPNLNIPLAAQAVEDLISQFQNGTITADQFLAKMDDLLVHTKPYIDVTHDSTAALAANTTAVNASGQAIADQMAAYDAQNQSLSQAIDFNTANTAAIVDDTAAREANGRAIAAQMAAYGAENPSLSRGILQAGALDGARASAMYAESIKMVGEAIGRTSAMATAGIPSVKEFGSVIADQAVSANATAEAIKAQSAGYFDLSHSLGKAVTAQEAFKGMQDDILVNENVYIHQQSEYESQVSAITSAHDLLNQKVADGGTLTQEETDFQNNYNDALARGQGAVDDATISQGLLAEQYLLNMKHGDDLNDSMSKQTDAVGNLVDEVQKLVDILLGVPPDTNATVHVGGVDDANSALSFMKQQLADLDGLSVTSFAQVVHSDVGSQFAFNPNTSGETSTGNALGGVAGYAGGGMVRAMLAEYGGEFVHLAGGGGAYAKQKGVYNVPRGSYVDTAPMTRNLMGMGSFQPIINIYGTDKTTEDIVRELVPALVQATETHYRAHGL